MPHLHKALPLEATKMTLQKFSILVLLTVSTSFAVGQEKDVINIDSSGLPGGYYSHNISTTNRKKALTGAESFIKDIVGDKFLSNIWLEFGETRGPGLFRVYGVREDSCYQLQYYVVDKTDTICYFRLLVDMNGIPVKYTYSSNLLNNVELIAGIKKHFEKKFKFSFEQAVTLGKQKGFWRKPYLTCYGKNNYNSADNSDVVKDAKYCWIFRQESEGMNFSILVINAETGNIEEESRPPKVPQ